MRAARLALVLTLPLMVGCTADLEEYAPMAMACKDARVQQTGWCDLGFQAAGLGAPQGEDRPREATMEGDADHVRWSHEFASFHGRASFAWDSPGRAALEWSAPGSGGVHVQVQSKEGIVYASASGSHGEREVLASAAGPWTVNLDFDNFAGRVTVELSR